MTQEEIDLLLGHDNDEAFDAHKDIVAMQKDKSSLLMFGKPWIDDNLIGGLNNKICFFGSRPSNGKTYHCSETVNSLLDTTLNPHPVRIARFNLEMPTQSLILQEVSKALGRELKDILSRPYKESEQETVGRVVNSFRDKRVKNISKVLKPDDFRSFMTAFSKQIDEDDAQINQNNLERLLEEDPDDKENIIKNFVPQKTKKIGLIDHLMIYKNKEEIDAILLICNELKMMDRNLSFIIYFQLRRDVENLWRESKDQKINPRNMLPNSTYIYQTDILQQVADIVVGMVIPQVYDLEDFVAVHKERNSHLSEHFSEDLPDNSFVRLKGRNRIYYNFMKIRLLNSFDDPRIFCDVLNPAYEQKANKLMGESKHSTLSTPMPRFETDFTAPPIPNYDMSAAFGEPEKTDNPF